MKRQRNVNLLLMLVLLVAVGQMAQTIYIPAMADMAHSLQHPLSVYQQLLTEVRA